MILIDKEKLISDVVERRYSQASMRLIREQPEVEAIPIEWIKQWSEKFYKVINGIRYYMGDGYDSVWDMLEDWEKENENISGM